MSDRKSFAEILADPRQGKWAVATVLVLFSWLALVLRLGLDVDGVLDSDVLNFGLAGFRFDVLDHQPHPPGYPGYVVLLKTVHFIAPWLDPIALAKWTTRVCGMLIVPAAYLACSQALGGAIEARGRSLFAAGFSILAPLLWFYGGDGQSHGAEALLTLVLFALAVKVKRDPSRLRLLMVVAAFAIAGSVRPTIPLLCSPLLVWIFWRRPLLDWLLALLVGGAIVASWYAVLVSLSGGLDLYRRATKALITDQFIASYSVFGARANFVGTAANIGATAWALLFSIVPILAASRGAGAWLRPVLAIAFLNVVFYTLVFTAEPGYLIQAAALATLVPATWKGVSGRSRAEYGRVVLAALACPVIIFAGPVELPIPYSAPTLAPTYARVVDQSNEQRIYRELMCGASEGEETLVITDNYVTTNERWLTMVCPHIAVALYRHDFPLNPALDNWLIFYSDRIESVPPEVPLEPGPPSTYTTQPVKRIVVTLGSTTELKQAMAASARCPAYLYAPYGNDFALSVWPAGCFETLEFGAHTVVVRSSGKPNFGDAFARDPL